MESRNTPHIGKTLKQRGILAYEAQQRDMETERFARIAKELADDAMIQPEPCQFCASDEVTEAPPKWLVVLGAIAWVVLLLSGIAMVAVQERWI